MEVTMDHGVITPHFVKQVFQGTLRARDFLFEQGRFVGIFEGIDFSNCRFKDCMLSEGQFRNCNFTGAVFDTACTGLPIGLRSSNG